MKQIQSPDELSLILIPNFRYDSRAKVVLGLDGLRSEKDFVLYLSNGVREEWYEFKNSFEVEGLMAEYNNGRYISARCYQHKS